MIRHSSSLLVSLVFHILLAFTIFLAYKTFFLFEKEEVKENRLQVKLCHIQTLQKTPKPIVKIKPAKKKIIKTKTLPKKALIKQIKPKPVVKVKKEKPKIVEVTEVKEEIQEEIKKENIIVKEEVTVKKNPVVTQTLEEKNKRLQKQYIENNIQKISQLLSDNLYYPRSARKRGITGTVVVKFKLSTSATAHNIIVLSSSSDVLSRAAIKTIENLSGKFPQPREELILHVPIEYKLRR